MDVHDVERWVQDFCHVVERFYPTAVAKDTGLPLDLVFRQLIGLSHIGWLDVAYEVCCEACSHPVKLVRTKDPTTLYEPDVLCELCGHEFEVTARHVFPVFFVNNQWREHQKKVPTARRDRVSSTGGRASLAEVSSGGESVTWAETLFPPDEYATLQESAKTDERIRELLDRLERIPQSLEEKRSRVSELKEFGEMILVWTKVGGYGSMAIGIVVRWLQMILGS